MSESSSSGSSSSNSPQGSGDLTDLISLSKKLQESGEFPESPSSEGALVLEAPPPETVTEFESLDSLPPADPIPEFPESLSPAPATDGEGNSDTPSLTEFPTVEPEAAPSEFVIQETAEEISAAADNPSDALSLDLSESVTTEPAPPLELDAGPALVSAPQEESFGEAELALPELSAVSPPEPAPEPVVHESPTPAPTPAHASASAPSLSGKRILASSSPIPAAFPFTLKIRGRLPAHHQSRLESLLERESLGVSAADLAPQMDAGRILIPRISEYALILILQSLRDAPVEFEAYPSDLEDLAPQEPAHAHSFAVGDQPESGLNSSTHTSGEPDSERAKRIDNLLVIPLGAAGSASIEERERLYKAMDVLTASLILSANVVRSPRSSDYLEAIERLKRELRHKAFWKGADILLDFTIQLQPVSSISQEGVAYRVTATGCAARRL